MHPLDVVKTRFQIQTTGKPGDPNYYTSVYDCMRKMARNEGVLSLYKGVLPPVLVETPKRAVKVRLPLPQADPCPLITFKMGFTRHLPFSLCLCVCVSTHFNNTVMPLCMTYGASCCWLGLCIFLESKTWYWTGYGHNCLNNYFWTRNFIHVYFCMRYLCKRCFKILLTDSSIIRGSSYFLY